MHVAEPHVQLLAHTALAVEGRQTAIEKHMNLDPEAGDMQQLIEHAGRSCYLSFHKPNPKTARNADYINRTLHDQGHWSIAEHASATFYITGVSRALTHELVRHRHLSFSQLSQRFVDESDANIVIPPAATDSGTTEVFLDYGYDGPHIAESIPEALKYWGSAALLSYQDLVKTLQDEGLPRKQAREAARAVLPNMIETRIVVTGNLRAWNEVIQRRTAPDADAEFQKVAGIIKEELHKLAPEVIK